MFYTISGPWFHGSNIAGASLVPTADRHTSKLTVCGKLTTKHKPWSCTGSKYTCSLAQILWRRTVGFNILFLYPPRVRGGGVRALLDRRFDRPKTSLGAVTKKPFPSWESNTDRPSHSLVNVLITAFELLLIYYTISGHFLEWEQLRGHLSSSHSHHTGLFISDKVKVNVSLRTSVRHTGKVRYSATHS